MRSTRTGSIRYHYTMSLWLPDGRIVSTEGLITQNDSLTYQDLYRKVKSQACKDLNVPEHVCADIHHTINENEPPRP